MLKAYYPVPFRKETVSTSGTANQTQLCGTPVKGALFEFAPAIDQFLKAHLFGDIFARNNLDWRTRELATIAMLTAMPGVEPQQKAHIAIGKKNGLSDKQINAIITLVQEENRDIPNVSDSFPLGEENTGFAQYFSGKSWLAPLATNKELNVPIYNVTFEPGCRNNWHKHTGGQILIVVSGVGYYQERGKMARRLVKGDVVEIPQNVEHWHGAAPDYWFSHLAVECNPKTNKNTWLESYDFSGKTVVLFATSGGSGFGKTLDNLKSSVSSENVMKEGKLLNGNPSDRDLTTWLKSLGL